MSDIIRLLPDSVANQIAAGEVIQRPASIIKELVENSLDAGATRIQIIVANAGKTSIQVIDNGKGMSETDARLSFERHATSKIREAMDLFSLQTMGFRGEALASIAAVAEVELRTKMEEDELGVSICIAGSRLQSQEPINCPTGANFLVKNLFFNIPARRKYLGSDQTEMKYIVGEYERIVLAHPDISFSLATPDAVLSDLQPGTFRQRIVNYFGRSLDKKLLSVQVETPIVQIAGFVGTPESSKKKNVQQFFFVNGRFMQHPYFAKAIIRAYERLIPEGEMVPFFLQLVVDPAKIDVNISPTKTKIKFEDESAIFAIIMATVREALGKLNAIPTIDFNTEDKPDIPVFSEASLDIEAPKVNFNPNFNPFDNTAPNGYFDAPVTKPGTSRTGIPQQPQRPPYNVAERLYGPENQQAERLCGAANQQTERLYGAANQQAERLYGATNQQESPFTFVDQDELKEKPLYNHLPAAEQKKWELPTDEFLQFKGRYLISLTDEGLLVIDATRAHTRILYEDYLKKIEHHDIESQGLLFPQTIELTLPQASLLSLIMEEVERVGFDLSPLGNNCFSILRVPSGIEGMDPSSLLLSILNDTTGKDVQIKEEIQKQVALSLARKTAVPSGQLLTQAERKDLVQRLFETSNPNHTPDGKKILAIVAGDMLLKDF